MSTIDVPPGIDMNSNDAPAMLGTVIATWLLLLLAFGGRLACRKILKMSLLLDDRLIIPAVVLATLEAFLITAYSTRSQVIFESVSDGPKWFQTTSASTSSQCQKSNESRRYSI